MKRKEVPIEDISTQASDSASESRPSFDDSNVSSNDSYAATQVDFSDIATMIDSNDCIFDDPSFTECSFVHAESLQQVQPIPQPVSYEGSPVANGREWPAGIVELVCLIRWAVGPWLQGLKVEKKSKKYFIHVDYGRTTTSMDLVNLRQDLEGGSSNCGPPRVVPIKHAVRVKCFETIPLGEGTCYDLRAQGFCCWKHCKWQHPKAAVVTIRLTNPEEQQPPCVVPCSHASYNMQGPF